MTDSRGWLDARRPPPPTDLRARFNAAPGFDASGLVDQLSAEALERLDRARAATGRVRESALHLLVADALLTYACEAALEGPDPDAALARMVEMAADAR